MQTLLLVLLWPVAAAFRASLEVLIWLRPSLASGRRVFPEGIRRLIEQARSVEVHRAELSDEPPEPGQLGRKLGWRSLGMVRLEGPRDRRRVIRSIVKANRESLGGFMCLDAEYAVRFESDLGRADLMICFDCMQVWVWAGDEAVAACYPISHRPLSLLDRLLRASCAPEAISYQERKVRRLDKRAQSALVAEREADALAPE